MGVAEKERNFFITRYYEIIDQLNEERQNKEIQSPFVYWKKIALLLSAIENFIKIFIEKIEMENSDDIKDINQSFSRYLGTMDYSNIKDGPIFKPSKYLNFFLSDDAKVILNYYLFAKYHASGLEIRNPTIHGSYISEEFLDQYYFFKINLLFFQLVEELTMNYVWSTLEKVNLNEFFRTFTLHNFKDKKIKISDFIKFNEERLYTHFQEYTRKKELNISDYAICFKLKYDENEKRFQLEIEGFKTFIYKVWI